MRHGPLGPPGRRLAKGPPALAREVRARLKMMGAMADPSHPGGDTGVTVPRTRAERETKRPTLFRVLLHNDDYTTQEFVVFVLMKFFQHDAATAHDFALVADFLYRRSYLHSLHSFQTSYEHYIFVKISGPCCVIATVCSK